MPYHHSRESRKNQQRTPVEILFRNGNSKLNLQPKAHVACTVKGRKVSKRGENLFKQNLGQRSFDFF
jgi:hypothetical protein